MAAQDFFKKVAKISLTSNGLRIKGFGATMLGKRGEIDDDLNFFQKKFLDRPDQIGRLYQPNHDLSAKYSPKSGADFLQPEILVTGPQDFIFEEYGPSFSCPLFPSIVALKALIFKHFEVKM